MLEYIQIQNRIFQISSDDEFESIALEIFKLQFEHVSVYRNYCELIGRTNPKTLEEIPFLPIQLFKTHKVIHDNYNAEICFLSSGTTGTVRSEHHVVDLSIYSKSFSLCFSQFFGEIEGKVILALLPNYIEQGSSSLVYMVSELIQKSSNPLSGFYLDDIDKLISVIDEAKTQQLEVILFGVSYALLDLAEKNVELSGIRIIETGGMKGRRKEMVKEELHKILSENFHVPVISSEYGMTELLSQAYSFEKGIFQTPSWMKILIRDSEDPFTWLNKGKTGGISVVDLANIYSCSFIHTQDLGKLTDDGFEIIGRFDSSDIRGCNLLVNN